MSDPSQEYIDKLNQEDGVSDLASSLDIFVGSTTTNELGEPTNAIRDVTTDPSGVPLDTYWTRSAFLISDATISDKVDIKNRYYSTAARKFTDTTLGGNIGINAKPQYCQYSDIRVKGRLASRNDVNVGAYNGNFGMGRYYSEAIDDNSRTIYLRFGVPQFNSLTFFMTNFYNHERSLLARTGRLPSSFYFAGQVGGIIAGFLFFPIFATALLIGKGLNMFLGRKNSKFYYFKPAMHSYWTSVNMLVNLIAVNKGIGSRIGMQFFGNQNAIGKPSEALMADMNKYFPDEYTPQGYDIYAVANRAQRIQNKVLDSEYASYAGSLQALEPKVSHIASSGIAAYVAKVMGSPDYIVKPEEQKGKELDPGLFIDKQTGEPKKANAPFLSILEAEFADGSTFVALKVDHGGSVGESFSNSVTESELANKINSVSSTVREARFSIANGNISDNTVTKAIQGFLGGVADFGMGMLDVVGLSGLGALAGSGFVDIPKHWQSSTANLPRASYSMTLISPYGNPVSQMHNIFIPLSCLLAGALPLSAGMASHTSPFLVQIWDRGRTQVQLGIIDSLSINRGVSTLPFTTSGSPLAVEVSFSIIDLTSLMHMPIPLFSDATDPEAAWNEDNPLIDYLAVLAGQDLHSQFYDFPKAKLRFQKLVASSVQITSPSSWAQVIHEETTTGLVNKLLLGIPGFISGMSAINQNVYTNNQ